MRRFCEVSRRVQEALWFVSEQADDAVADFAQESTDAQRGVAVIDIEILAPLAWRGRAAYRAGVALCSKQSIVGVRRESVLRQLAAPHGFRVAFVELARVGAMAFAVAIAPCRGACAKFVRTLVIARADAFAVAFTPFGRASANAVAVEQVMRSRSAFGAAEDLIGSSEHEFGLAMTA